MIACSRMYNLAPAIRAGWDAIFRWMMAEADAPMDIIDHAAPAPLADLWSRDDMGLVFMCGWPWAMSEPRPRLLAVPVPSPNRYGGEAVYFTDLVVRADSDFQSLEDTFGGRIAWTVEDSHSGFNAVRHQLLPYRRPDRPTLFSDTVGPVISPLRSIQAVLDGDADVGPVDSMAMDLLRKHDPERVARLRVVETTDAAPMPPLISSPTIDPAIAARLTEAAVRAHEVPDLAGAFSDVLVSRFAPADPKAYDLQLTWAAEAIDSGYPMVA